jgi:hypothetical protein
MAVPENPDVSGPPAEPGKAAGPVVLVVPDRIWGGTMTPVFGECTAAWLASNEVVDIPQIPVAEPEPESTATVGGLPATFRGLFVAPCALRAT